MNWKKHAAALPLACCMLLASCAVSASEAGTGGPAFTGAEAALIEAAPRLTLADIRAVSFSDVSSGGSRADCISYTAYQGILQGTEDGRFQPDALATRAALLEALFRMSGEDAPAYEGGFSDVTAEDPYAGAVAWGLQTGLFGDIGEESPRLDLQEPVTRLLLAELLFRHAARISAQREGAPADNTGYVLVEAAPENGGLIKVESAGGGGTRLYEIVEESGSEGAHAYKVVEAADFDGGGEARLYEVVEDAGPLDGFRDGGHVPAVSVQAMAWTLEQGLFNGMVSDTIYPKLPVSRGQLAETLTALYALENEEPLAKTLASLLRVKTVESASLANHDGIQTKVNETAARYGAAGLQVAVVEDGVVTDTFAYGWATRGSDPMTASHKLRVASLSKVSVGLAAMLLRDRGVIDLDESIGTYWGCSARNPSYPDTPVSVRSLLSHTSSIPLYGDDVSRARGAVQARLQSGAFSNLKPGSVYSWGYNNYGFAVLGMTLELAANDYLDCILRDGLWSIMEIDAAFESGCIEATDKLVTLYRHDGSVSRTVSAQAAFQRPASPGDSGTSFAGGLTISAADTAKLIALLANDGRWQGLQLLSEESVAIMETRFDQILSDGTYQAMPLRSQDNIYGRDRLYYHTGSAYGVYNCMSYDPDTGDGVVVLSVGASAARDDHGIYAVCGDITQYIYELTA